MCVFRYYQFFCQSKPNPSWRGTNRITLGLAPIFGLCSLTCSIHPPKFSIFKWFTNFTLYYSNFTFLNFISVPPSLTYSLSVCLFSSSLLLPSVSIILSLEKKFVSLIGAEQKTFVCFFLFELRDFVLSLLAEQINFIWQFVVEQSVRVWVFLKKLYQDSKKKIII